METLTTPRGEDPSERGIEDVEAGESDGSAASKKPWWARLWTDATETPADEKMRQKKGQKENREMIREIEATLKEPDCVEVSDFPLGYPLQAAFQSSTHEFSIYRNFSYLHSRVILELQDQLREFEGELQMLDKLHSNSEDLEQRSRVRSRVKDLEAAQPTIETFDEADNSGAEPLGSHHVARSILSPEGVVHQMLAKRPGSDHMVRSASSAEDQVQQKRSSANGKDPEAIPPTICTCRIVHQQAGKSLESHSIEQVIDKPIISERAALLEQIQQKLVRYDEVLVHARRLAEFQRPTDDEWLNLRKWYFNKRHLNSEDEDKFIRMKHDLITLRPRTESGNIDDWIRRLLVILGKGKITSVFYKPYGEGFQDKFISYFDVGRIERVAVVLVAIVIILLLAVPVFVMFRITWMGTRESTFLNIGLLIAFGLLFSAAMGLLTRAKRAELFAATAAYCAVLVVFIGNFSSNTGSNSP